MRRAFGPMKLGINLESSMRFFVGLGLAVAVLALPLSSSLAASHRSGFRRIKTIPTIKPIRGPSAPKPPKLPRTY